MLTGALLGAVLLLQWGEACKIHENQFVMELDVQRTGTIVQPQFGVSLKKWGADKRRR